MTAESRRSPRSVPVEWVLIAGIAIAGLVSVGAGEILWGGLVGAVAVVVTLPALALGDRTATVAWPLLAVALLAALARVAGVATEAAGYALIVVVALIVVIELQAFTAVELSLRFAVVFSVMTTMALQGVWIVAQSASDRWLGSSLFSTQAELQWDIVLVTVLAVVVGLLYYAYARRYDQARSITIPTDDRGPR